MNEEPLDPHIFGEDQACFGCSPTHPFGLHLRFSRVGDTVTTRFLPGENYQGPPGIMHGGLVTTVADELAAWAIIALRGRFGFTAAIESRFLRPLRVGIPVFGVASITSEPARIVKVNVVLRQEESDVYKGTFTFVVVDQAGAEKMLQAPLPEAWKRFCREP